MRLIFALLTCLSSGVGATVWRAHYVPVGASGFAQTLAVDSSGNVFVSAVAETSEQVQTCVFKMDGQGNVQGEICFARQQSAIVAVGPDGNPVVAGTTYSPSSVKLVSPLFSQTGPEAGYVIKFNSDLTGIIFSTLVGGPTAGSLGAGTTISALTIDQKGTIYVAGWTADGAFPLTAGAFQTTPPVGAIPAFVTAISSTGDRILWSTMLGGPKPPCTNCNAGLATVSNLAVDSAGAVVIAGSATTEQMPVTSGVIGDTCQCAVNVPEAFLAKLAPGGAQLAWATYVTSVSLSALALDANDDVIIGGQAYTGFTATAGALQTAYPGAYPGDTAYNSATGFVAKLDALAARYLFATWLGGNNFQQAIASYEILAGANGVTGVALDTEGTIWATGGSLPSALPLAVSTPVLGSNYILGLSPDGSSVRGALTAPEGGAALGIAISPQGPVALGKSGSTLMLASTMPALAGLTNSAGLTATGSVSPNELVSLYGEGLGPSTALSAVVANGRLPLSLAGVQVEFDGVAAPLLYTGSNQINAVVPSEVAGRSSTTVTIVTPAGQITGLVLSVVPSIPAVFADPPPGNAARALNQDGTLNSITNPAAAGSIVSVWATGAGVSASPEADGAITGATGSLLQLAVSVGNGFPGALPTAPILNPVSAPQVQFAGNAPGLVKGEIQVNFQIPTQVGIFSGGAFQFYLHIGSATSDPFTVYVR